MNYCPTVDVIIPCYNVDHIVEKCINSIIKQEYENIVKIYLINDGSTDNSLKILKDNSNQYQKLINLEKNIDRYSSYIKNKKTRQDREEQEKKKKSAI